jgi:GNAT superfamily N-acetyltransferase
MDTDRRFQEAADANFVASYRKLVEHDPAAAMREFGGVFAFTTGLPIGLFNGCLVVRQASQADLRAAIGWVGGSQLPFRVWIREELAPDLAVVPPRHGLLEEPRRYPGMALHPVPEPPPPPPGVAVRRVIEPPDLEEHRGILIADGASTEVVRRLLPDAFLSDPDVALVTADLDGRPVGTALAIRSGDVSGVYNVGTRPSARRRGVGMAATWAAVAAGRSWGCDLVVLQSTEMGQSVYEAMGFRTVVRYVEFRQPAP